MRSRSSGTAHRPEELLGVAELVQDPLVLVRVVPAAGGAGSISPSRPGRQRYHARLAKALSTCRHGTRIRIALVLDFEELRTDVESGAIDTVVVAFTDMQGACWASACTASSSSTRSARRPSGRGLQLPARARDGDGSRSRGTRSRAGNAVTATSMVPDLATLRRIPWLEGTALVLCDVQWHDGSPVARRRGRSCARRWAGRGARFTPMFGLSSRFFLLATYAEAHAKGTRA